MGTGVCRLGLQGLGPESPGPSADPMFTPHCGQSAKTAGWEHHVAADFTDVPLKHTALQLFADAGTGKSLK